jgi:hypothetical protein
MRWFSGAAVIARIEAARGPDAAVLAKWLVLLGLLYQLSEQRNPERVHYPVMPQEELDVTAQLRRVHLLEQFQVHLPAIITDTDLDVRH